MSLFFRARREPEARAVTSIAGWGRGDDVLHPSDLSSSLSIVPVFAATRLISDAIATLPLHAYTRAGETRTPIDLPPVFLSKEKRIQFVQQALFSLLLRGNAYGYVTAFGNGTPRNVTWLSPDKVSIDESGPLPVYRYNGREIPREQMRHLPAYPIPGCFTGVSPIGACSMLGSTAANVQRRMTDWFSGNKLPGSTFQNTKQTLDMAAAGEISDGLNARIKAGKPLVYGSDWKFDAISLSASDVAFVESSKLTATQIATIYGIPPDMIGGETGSSLTYSTVEQNALNFAQFTLHPWIAKLEEEFSSWLPDPQFVKFNLDAMIRVDAKTRREIYQIDRNIGIRNVDEIRALEDEAPLPDGKGQDFTPLGAGDSAARLIQQMYLGVGKVITAKEAREILKKAGAFIDDNVTLDELHANLPPIPAQDEPPKENQA